MEKEIIELVCKELANKKIGDTLFPSGRTIEGHRLKILGKMNVKNRVGLVVYALKSGNIKPEFSATAGGNRKLIYQDDIMLNQNRLYLLSIAPNKLSWKGGGD
jgi:DNA-binding CsgD family transcriptional regulator